MCVVDASFLCKSCGEMGKGLDWNPSRSLFNLH